jgi:hypothetical protein
MKPVPLILGFLPLVLFSLLARLLPSGDIGIAALIAALAAAGAIVAIRPVWPPKILSACSLVIFAVLAVAGFAGGAGTDQWLATWAAAGVGIVMGLVILALIPVIPFTEQFARQVTPQAYWSSPTFKKINRVLSSAWGAAIVLLGISRVIAAAIHRSGGAQVLYLVFSAVIPVVIGVYMLKFSKSYPERASQSPSSPAVSSP